MANSHGGRRPGAGRKPGSPTKRRREIIDKAADAGITPLELQLRAMRELWRRAHANGEMDVGLAEKACQIARDCAPFVHPRLASVDARIDAVNRHEIAVDVIGQEQRLIELAFGELSLLHRPKVIEAVEIAEPVSGDSREERAADGG